MYSPSVVLVVLLSPVSPLHLLSPSPLYIYSASSTHFCSSPCMVGLESQILDSNLVIPLNRVNRVNRMNRVSDLKSYIIFFLLLIVPYSSSYQPMYLSHCGHHAPVYIDIWRERRNNHNIYGRVPSPRVHHAPVYIYLWAERRDNHNIYGRSPTSL